MIELVVAHYNENLNWLRNVPKNLRITVYDKGRDDSANREVISLPNVGREAHTYLHHLVSNYDSLADWTIFCQGKPFDHAYDFKKSLREFAADPVSLSTRYPQGFGWLGHLIDTDDNQGHRLFKPWSKNEDNRGLNLLEFHRALFDTDGPKQYTFFLGAQFAVHRNVVRQKPVSFYKRALDVSVTFPDAAHCFERSWDRVFNVTGVDAEWLSGQLTVYLKPMKYQTLPNKITTV